MIDQLKEKKILILGFGREGRDTLEFFKRRFPNKKIGIADRKKKEVAQKNVETYFGEGYLDSIKDYEVIIKSPGIPFSLIEKFSDNRVITSQTDIFLKEKRDSVIGVTGTKGKSTTSLLIHNILKKERKDVYLLGNIGEPVLNFLEKSGIFIYELSSFQLQTTKTSPGIALILNIFKDHLDQHKNFKRYRDSKKNILKFQKTGDKLIYNEKDPIILEMIKSSKADKIAFNPERRIKNSAVYLEPILKTVKLFGVSEKKARKVIKKSSFLPHRMELVGEFREIKFFNDSAATIPEAAAQAVKNTKALKALITGGVDKGGDYDVLAEEIAESGLELLVLFPETGKYVEKKLRKITKNPPKIIYADSMNDAVLNVYENISSGSCLLSPASSSFNMFSSYKDRGDQFKKYVKKYGKQ